MNNKYVSLFKDIFIFALGNIGSKMILFFMVPLYTNYMTTDEYGVSDYVFTISQLLIPFLSVVIFDAIVRFGLMKNQRKEDVLVGGLIVVGVGSLVMVLITPIFSFFGDLSQWKWYICVYVILNMFASVQMNYLKVKDKNKIYAIISILQTLTLASTNVITLVFLDMGIHGYLTSTILANAFVVIASFVWGKFWIDFKVASINKVLIKEMLLFSSPLILNNISWWVVQSANKVFVELFLGASMLGIYTVATKIPSLINVFTSIFSQAWGISSVKEIEEDADSDFYSSVFLIYQTMIFGATIALISVTKPFMQVYVGQEFLGAWVYVPILLASAAFSAIASYFGTMYGALKKSVNNMLTTASGAIVNIIVNVLAIPVIGVWGAVIGTLLTYVVISMFRMYDVKRFIVINVHFKLFLINAMIMMIQVLCISVDLHGYLVSALCLCAFCIINRRVILNVILTIKTKLFK